MGRSKRNKNKRADNYSAMAAAKVEQRAKKKQERNEKRRIAKKQIMEKRYLVGFYGDYRQGTKEHAEISKVGMHTVFKGIYATEPEYALYQIKGASESALLKGNNSVVIEVYEISESTLEKLDIYHGFDKDSSRYEEQYYLRREIESPFTKIYIYFWNEEIQDKDILIKDGDWVDYIKNIKKNKSVNESLTNAYGTACIEIADKEFMD